MDFTEQQIERYSRHILLGEVGGIGQEKLLNAKVLVVGAGGLGSPLLLYLAAAGIGTIGVVDADVVDLSNLQRQVIHDMESLDQPKVASAAKHMRAINPEIEIVPFQRHLEAGNAAEIINQFDLVCDGSDNFETRFLVNDACFLLQKPLVSGAILRFDGQIYTFRAFEDGEDRPCYRCLFREPPPPGQVPTCSQAGVMGALCGVVGSLQATEVIKEILGIGQSMAGALMIYDGLAGDFRRIKLKRDPGCPLCGSAPTITGLDPARYHPDPEACR